MEKRIVYPGVFDPITLDALSYARLACQELGANVTFFLLDDPRAAASLADREAMLRLALKQDGSPSFAYAVEGKGRDLGALLRECRTSTPSLDLFLLLDPANSGAWKGNSSLGASPKFLGDPSLGFPLARELAPSPASNAESGARTLGKWNLPSEAREYLEQRGLYYAATLRELLHSEHRYLHSLSVARLAYEIALANGLPSPEKAYIAGLLHDDAKHLGREEEDARMRKDHPEWAALPEWSYHQFLGADIAKERFGIEDEEILDAIRYHATGKAHMSPLGKILYASDKIDPLRGYDSSKMINSCLASYHAGFLVVLRENRIFLGQRGCASDNPLTDECYQEYLGEDL